MSWIQKLYETYENCQLEVGAKTEDNKTPLVPIAHILQQAQIEIIIDKDGNFKGANSISKNDTETIIPCTEESGSRSGSDPKSHPLCDKLQYVAKNFSRYVEGATPQYIEKQTQMHESYKELLKTWCNSEFPHPKVNAVLKYIQKGTLTEDLINSGILSCDSNRKLKSKYASMVVRWIVYISNDFQDEVWWDKSLFDSWKNFEASFQNDEGFCYVTGNNTRLAKYHPKYIRVPGDSAKLISFNDTSGFTFLGRFQTAKQACGVSYEVTQKAHNALRWLIGRQGKVFYDEKGKEPGLTIVAWAVSGKDIPDLMVDTFDILGLNLVQSDSELPVSTAQEVALKLSKKMVGYSIALGNTNGIVVMGLDSATPGRMAITFYRELTGSDFLKRLEEWHRTCCWMLDGYEKEIKIGNYTQGKKKVRFMGAPAPSDIAEAAYGKDSKLRKITVERLLPCIIEGQKIPQDLVETVVRQAIYRISNQDKEANKALSIACALYKKYRKDYRKEEIGMPLDEKRNNRDYLYGRLLALADSLEAWAIREGGEKRTTNAQKLMQRFAEHPYTTWLTIEKSLTPYKVKLGRKAEVMINLISKIGAMFTLEDFKKDKKLDGEFLLGFYCQHEEIINMIKEKQKNKVEQKSDN